MKFVKISSDDLANIKVIRIEADSFDGMIREIRLICDNDIVKINYDYSQLLVFQKEKPKLKDIWIVTGIDILDSAISREFYDEWDANRFIDSAKGTYTNLKIEKTTRIEDE